MYLYIIIKKGDRDKSQLTNHLRDLMHWIELCLYSPNTGRRTFFINHQYGGCTVDAGWFMLKDYDATGECQEWDVMSGTPYFYYSASTTLVNWSSGK